jgi:hypothetical protein
MKRVWAQLAVFVCNCHQTTRRSDPIAPLSCPMLGSDVAKSTSPLQSSPTPEPATVEAALTTVGGGVSLMNNIITFVKNAEKKAGSKAGRCSGPHTQRDFFSGGPVRSADSGPTLVSAAAAAVNSVISSERYFIGASFFPTSARIPSV